MPGKPTKIADNFSTNLRNNTRKYNSNFEKISEIFWNDFLEVSRIC